jgi:hypothetical protein
MKELRQELATLKAAPTRGVQPGADSSKKPPKRTSALPPDIQDNVKNLAKKWCVLHDPWIPSDAFMKPPADNLDVDVDVNSAERYQNQEEYTAGLVNELHVYLSTEKLRKLAMKTRAFSADVRHSLTSP